MYILPIVGVIGEDFKMSHLLMHLKAIEQNNEQAVKIIINSPGGYTADADKMVDELDKLKILKFSTNSGDVASAAVKLFLTAPRENRTFDPRKGQFLIHMPYLDPSDGGATGTAEEIQAVADEMKKNEKKLAQAYSKKTGTGANILEGFMKENIPLTDEQIQSLGFATIIKQEFKAVAYYKNENDMTNEELDKKLSPIQAAIAKIMAFVKPKNLMVQDTTGKELDFGPDVQDPSQIVAGITATVDGQPAEGEFPMPDGSVLVFAAGTLTEVRPSASAELQAANKKIEELTASLTAKEKELETFKADAQKQINEVNTQFLAFKNQFSKGKEGSDGGDPEGGKPADPPKNRSAFKKKE